VRGLVAGEEAGACVACAHSAKPVGFVKAVSVAHPRAAEPEA